MKVIIIGSGPAAAAATLALLGTGRCQIEILDVGERLDAVRGQLLGEVSDTPPTNWPAEIRAELSRQPAAQERGELPQKWMFGSDFPFRDAGQLTEVSAAPLGNQRPISGAFGGFSNAWGAQVMPFTRETLDAWPAGYDAMVPHYRAMLNHIPFAGVNDDYSDYFPLMAAADPLPRLAPPAARLMSRYKLRRRGIQSRGVTMGEARLAMSGSACVECGLCLTGCPYGLVYSASQTLQPLLENGAVSYRDGILATRVGEDGQGCWIEARDLTTDTETSYRADRVLLACGGLGTTRVVLNSIRRDTSAVAMQESVQLVVPFVSAAAAPDPRSYSTFTLNQVNLLIAYGRPGLDLAQVHLYPYNPTFEDALPAPVARSPVSRSAILKRAIAGLGYLPSWASPSLVVSVSRGRGPLPRVHLGSRANPAMAQALLGVFRRLVMVAPALDLWPALPSVRISGPGKSYHFGGSFPHVEGVPAKGGFETDDLGRPWEWSRIHLIDGSVFPTVAATTFTLTVMANAHRIASAIGEKFR